MKDYYSLLEYKLEANSADSNQSRQVVFDLVRDALKRELFAREPSLTSKQIQEQTVLFEMTIELVEANAANRDVVRDKRGGLISSHNPTQPTTENTSPPTPPATENTSPSTVDSNFEVIRPSSRPTDRSRDLVVLPPSILTRSNPYANDEFADGYYPVPAIREPSFTPETIALIELLAREQKSTSRMVLSWLDGLFRLAIVAAVGFGIYAFWSGRIMEFAGLATTTPAVRNTPAAPVTPAVFDPSVPRPTVFGVYAIHNDRLVRLEQVATTPVDQRSRTFQQITSPSRTMFPDGRLTFTVYRRDLVTSAPVTVSIRFAARFASMLRFGPTGSLVMTRPDVETWLIYTAGYEFEVLPVPDNQEMILIRPADPNLVLPAGRYELMLNDQAYDFVVAGDVTDPRACVEGSPTARGPVFYQCKTAENR